MTTTDERMADHIRQALANPDATVLVASLDAQGGMVRQLRTTRITDLVDLAQSLLSEARDHWEGLDELTPEQETMLDNVSDALFSLPDPLEDKPAAAAPGTEQAA